MAATYTYYVKYNGYSAYAVAIYYLHTQPVYTKDANGNILSSPAPYSADSYGYDYVTWSGGSHLDSTYASSLPSSLFNGATTYSGDQADSITLTYATQTAKLTDIIGTFAPTERFVYAYGSPAPTTAAPTTATPTTAAPTTAASAHPTFYPTIVPLATLTEKSLDFAFKDISYASTHIQKHGDSKHATLTITDHSNLMFNGQFLGDTFALPAYIETGKNPDYSDTSDPITSYVLDNLTYDVNIHTFKAERVYSSETDLSNNAYNTSFGIISHVAARYSAPIYSNSYAYIFNFGNGRLTTTIKDTKHNKVVGNPNAPFGGDRLRWNSQLNKYLINQFGMCSVNESDTDPIPTATASTDGLLSKSSYSYVYSETGKLRTDVDALKKVTQAPCAYYVDFDTSPLFYRGASTGMKTTTYSHNNFWDQLLNLSNAVCKGLQIIGYSNNPQTAKVASYSYINVSSAYYGCLFNSPVGDNSYCITTWYTYNSRIYNSYIYMSSTFWNTETTLSYLMMAYVSPLNMQEITSSNEGTFIK